MMLRFITLYLLCGFVFLGFMLGRAADRGMEDEIDKSVVIYTVALWPVWFGVHLQQSGVIR